jgi:NAD(P)-dependent dehydrogenase (short-subunit alcohol dehydrogenase family)
MDLQLAGRRALVTGASSGIGRGIAQVLGREGVTVVVHGRHPERAEATAVAIRSTGGSAFVRSAIWRPTPAPQPSQRRCTITPAASTSWSTTSAGPKPAAGA